MQPLDLGYGCLRLHAVILDLDDLHLSTGNRITRSKLTASRQHFPVPIDSDRVFGLHSIRVVARSPGSPPR